MYTAVIVSNKIDSTSSCVEEGGGRKEHRTLFRTSVYSSVRSCIRVLVPPFIRWLVRSFVLSSVRLFVEFYNFIHFIPSSPRLDGQVKIGDFVVAPGSDRRGRGQQYYQHNTSPHHGTEAREVPHFRPAGPARVPGHRSQGRASPHHEEERHCQGFRHGSVHAGLWRSRACRVWG